MNKVIIIIILKILLITFLFPEEQTKENTKGLIIKKEEKEAVKNTRDIDKIEAYSKSNRWAIIIGVNDYEDKFIADLSKAQNDAKVLSDLLKNEGQFDYVYTFTDDTDKKSELYPSLNNIIAKLDFLKSEIAPNDTLLFSFSGHGISDDQGRSYLLTADTVISQPYKTSLPLYEVEDWIKDLKILKNIVLLDACRNVLEKTKGINTKTLIEERNSQAEISAIMYATSPGEFSYEHDKEPYGVFTTYIIDGLRGKADKDNDVLITFNELRDYVENGVRKWALNNNKKQKPYTSIRGEFHGDIVLSIIPLKERVKYNPYDIRNNYRMQYNIYMGLNVGSLATMITSLTGISIGFIIGGVGYYKYSQLQLGDPREDFNLYHNMKNSGFITGFVFGGLTIAAIIPFIVSYTVRPGDKTKKKGLSFNIDYYNKNINLEFSFKFN